MTTSENLLNVSWSYDIHNNDSVTSIYYTTDLPKDEDTLLLERLGERRKDIISVSFLTLVYTAIFITGVIGNLSTCIVIWRNPYMHTVTNYYLFSLGVSDVLTLLLALPQEVFTIWEAYPWRFGEAFCILKSYIVEMTSYSSVLTITGFTIERYIAICHPVKIQGCCHVSRATRCITLVWTVSIISALPYAVHTRLFYYLIHPSTGEPIPDSLVCNIPSRYGSRMLVVFQISTFLYFVLPMVIIVVFYVLIGVKLRQTELNSEDSNSPQYGKATATRARRAVLKMLVAVVVAFFVCWAPFHAQRLMTLYVKPKAWTRELIEIQSHLFYVSGVLFFFSCTVNPILYNLLSRKFRRAFKRTLCRCCMNMNSLPSFYKLKAKFINNDSAPAQDTPSGSRHQNADKNTLRMATFYRNDKANNRPYGHDIIEHPSTRDTVMKGSSRSSTCSSHAHSDGGLHYLCRHKRCLTRRQSQLTPRQNCNVASYQDIDALRRRDPDMRRTGLIDQREVDSFRHSSAHESFSVCDNSVNDTDKPVLRITLQL